MGRVLTKRILAALCVAAALAVAGCGGGDDEEASTTSAATSTSSGTTGTSGPTGAAGANGGSSEVKGALASAVESLESNGYAVTELPVETYEGVPSVEHGVEAGILATKDGTATSVYAFPSAEDAAAWAVDVRDTSTGSKVEVVDAFGFSGAKDDANADLGTVIEDAGL